MADRCPYILTNSDLIAGKKQQNKRTPALPERPQKTTKELIPTIVSAVSLRG
jgi:hypothetical protein